MCFSTKADLVLFLCTFIYRYNLWLWVFVFCPCVNLQYILLFADVFLSTSDLTTKSFSVFLTERTLFTHAVIMVIRTAAKA